MLRRAVQGDSEAFTQLYCDYQPLVYRLGRALTGCPSAAEDLTQETFVALFAGLARYDPQRATFTTYLYGIVRNLNRHRTRREQRFIQIETLGSHEWLSEIVSGGAAHHVDRAAHVRHALARLPPRYRELIELCDLDGRSYAEAAIVTRLTIGTVRSRLHRGRQLLRRRLVRTTPRPGE